MSKIIPPLDLMWLLMETPTTPTHIGGLLLFQRPAGRPGLVREIVEAYRSYEPVPPFNYVPKLGLRVPRFVESGHIDHVYHVQHLAMPAGSTHDDFLRLVTDLQEPMLDHGRPLFRMWIIEGLPDRQFAIYMKMNHSIIDGASAAHLIASSLGTSPRDRIKPPPFAVTTAPRKPRPSRPLAERLARMGMTATRQAAALKDVSLSALRKTLSEWGGTDPGGSRAFTARHSPMNEPLPVARSLATLSLPLDEMREVGRHYGATLNDVVVAVTDEGVHRYLRATGRTFPHRLVASCPMSMREEGDTEAATKVSAMFVHLGRHEATITDRIGQVVAAMDKAKKELRSKSRDAAMLYVIAAAGLAGARESTGAARVTPPLANLVISNVPGPRETMYLNGARLVCTYAVPGVPGGIGLNVTVSSYANLMNFGFGGNGVTMHSLPEMARHVADAYAEPKAAASRHGRGRATGPTRAPRRHRPSGRRT